MEEEYLARKNDSTDVLSTFISRSGGVTLERAATDSTDISAALRHGLEVSHFYYQPQDGNRGRSLTEGFLSGDSCAASERRAYRSTSTGKRLVQSLHILHERAKALKAPQVAKHK